MRLAIMQPYFFPYIGYFQLMQYADKLLFYDDVDYIKGGWINRNRILRQGEISYFTVPLSGQSSNRSIASTEVVAGDRWKRKMLKGLHLNFCKAPHFDTVYPLVEAVILGPSTTIAELSVDSVIKMKEYFSIDCEIDTSSRTQSESNHLSASARVLEICGREGADTYVNPAGGHHLYNKEQFQKQGIDLRFLQTRRITYSRSGSTTEEHLSILDVAMYNTPTVVRRLLGEYDLT